MRRALGLGAAVTLLLIGGAAAARHVAFTRAEDALSARGMSWASAERGLLSAEWRYLTGPGVAVRGLSLSLLPTPSAVIEGAQVKLDEIDRPSGGGGGGGGLDVPLALSAEGVDVLWGETVIAEDLSGPLLPALSLTGPGAAISRTDGVWSGELTRAIDSADLPVSGMVTLAVSGSDPVQLSLSVPQAHISHPVLAARPLPPVDLRAEATWEGGHVDGTAHIGDVAVGFTGPLSPDTINLSLTAEAVAFESVLDLFGERLIPERKRTEVRGSFTFTGRLSGPPLTWSAAVSAEDLGAEGALHDAAAMRWGNFSWRAPGAEGGHVIRQTGDEHPAWTDIEQARLAGDAAIASEDARFPSHGGYDLEGINVALTELSAGEERPRGGSTITQQLAKNLFLDGERTVARKLRELLYALEMERTLGKLRILELYLNVVEYGPGIYGIRQAADAYFLKRPENLSPHEAAFLAAILPSPRPWHAKILAGRRPPQQTVNRILSNMAHHGAIDEKTARWAQSEPLIFVLQPSGG